MVVPMKLDQYLTSRGISRSDFGKAVGVTPVAITRYINGNRFPDKDMILRIESETSGEVAVRDWYAPEDAA